MHTEFIEVMNKKKEGTSVCRRKLNKKKIAKKLQTFFWEKNGGIFGGKSRNGEELTKLSSETESQNSVDHEFWHHKMRGYL